MIRIGRHKPGSARPAVNSDEAQRSTAQELSRLEERELLRRLRRPRRRWRGTWLSMAAAMAGILVLAMLFHAVPEKFLRLNPPAQHEAALIEERQRTKVLERDLAEARDEARALKEEGSATVDTRRGLTGPIETPDDPRQRSLTVQPEESNSTANREAAATAATSFGSSEERKLLERADTLLKLGDQRRSVSP